MLSVYCTVIILYNICSEVDHMFFFNISFNLYRNLNSDKSYKIIVMLKIYLLENKKEEKNVRNLIDS